MCLSFIIAAALANTVILRSESRGAHDHILLSQIRETPPTWRARSPYLYPPGTGWPGCTLLPNTSYNHFARTPRKTLSSVFRNAHLPVCYLAIRVLLLLNACVAGMCSPTRCLAVDIRVTTFSLLTYLHIPSLVVRLCES
jgi:hypothetical protein